MFVRASICRPDGRARDHRRTTGLSGDGDGCRKAIAAQAAESSSQFAARAAPMSLKPRSIAVSWSIVVLVSCAGMGAAIGQAQPAAPPAKQAGASPLEPLSWLPGCWEGKVNLRDFREEWLP